MKELSQKPRNGRNVDMTSGPITGPLILFILPLLGSGIFQQLYNTVDFIFIDALEYQGDFYLALAEPEEDDAVFFLKVEQDEDGNDIYNAPDEALEDILFEKFSELHSGNEEDQ